MKTPRVAIPALTLSACLISLLLPAAASAQDVRLQNVSFDQVLTELFGTPETPGLLDGQKKFKLHAEGVTLTREEASTFFAGSSSATENLGDLITGAGQLQGTELQIKGLVRGSPFELRVSPRQVKLDGINLTQADLDAVVEQMQGVSALRESRIDAMVDGRPVVVRLQDLPVRIDSSSKSEAEAQKMSLENLRTPNAERREQLDLPERARTERMGIIRVERIERPPIIERIEKLKGKPEKPERIRVERPERDDDDD